MAANLATNPGRADDRALRANRDVALATPKAGRLATVPVAVKNAFFAGNGNRAFARDELLAARAAEGLQSSVFGPTASAAWHGIHRNILIQVWGVRAIPTLNARAALLGYPAGRRLHHRKEKNFA